jgi:uncharacterized small protein (DUF1192 family)
MLRTIFAGIMGAAIALASVFLLAGFWGCAFGAAEPWGMVSHGWDGGWKGVQSLVFFGTVFPLFFPAVALVGAALGLAAGGGMYEVGMASAGMALFALIVLHRLKVRELYQFPRRVAVVLKDDGMARQAVVERLAASGVSVADVDYDLNVRRHRSRLALDVRLLAVTELDRRVTLLAAMPEVRRVKVQRPSV